MKDKLGREINYLRISVTRRCNLNCSYCGHKKDSRGKELTPDEILTLTAAFAKKGITKVRLTGGEPLVREDIAEIAEGIKGIDGIKSLYITTNGILLKKYAPLLRKAGVDGVNISLDTLDKRRFAELTGTDRLRSVKEGIEAALGQGFKSVKINSVLVKGRNDDEALRLMELARDNMLDVRFIELMPFSAAGENEKLVVTTAELLERADFLYPDENVYEGTAEYYKADGFKGRVGFISPRSRKFCASCNRIRLLCDGSVKPCLGNEISYDLMPFIENKELLEQKIEEVISDKPLSHHFEKGEFFRGLNLIGG